MRSWDYRHRYGQGRRRRRPWYDFRIKAMFRLMRCRWTATTPKLFRTIGNVATGAGSVALAIHVALTGAGYQEPGILSNIFMTLIGLSAGVAALAKFTQSYDKDGVPVRKVKKGNK